MKRSGEMNVWARNNTPALEFCSLPRAAELLGCQVSDLIHFAHIGAVEFCLNFDRFEAVLITHALDEWEEAFPPYIEGRHKNKSPLSTFSRMATFHFKNDGGYNLERLYHHPSIPSLKSPLISISGLWALTPMSLDNYFFSGLQHNREVTLTALDFGVKEADIPFSLDNFGEEGFVMLATPPTEHLYTSGPLDAELVTPIVTITANDIYLTRKQIEKVANGVGLEIPNHLNGGVLAPENLTATTGKSVRTTIKQSDYIVALLKIAGITDNELLGSITELKAKIGRKSSEIALPEVDDNTLVDWLRRAGVNR